MCVAVSFITRRCVGASLDPCLFLFLSEYLLLFGYVVTNCTCIGTSLDPRFSLFLSVSVSVSRYILSVICMYVNKRDQLAAQRMIALNTFVFSFLSLCVYVCLLIGISFFLFRAECLYQFSDIFWLIVCPSTSLGCVCFSHFSLNICSSDWLYYHSLYVSMSIAWSVFVSLLLYQCL